MPQVLKDLLHSEKAVVALAILVAVSVLFGFDKVSADLWEKTVTWVGSAYLVAKSIEGGLSKMLPDPPEPPDSEK